jgi:nicotinamidase/pyrazinamidase
VISYDDRTALVVVDVQNDFADPGGSLFVRGAPEIISTIDDEIDRAARAGALVVYTQDWHPLDTPHFAKDGGVWPVHCVIDTWGAEFHPDLVLRGEVIRKGSEGEDGYSGFSVRDPKTGEVDSTRLESLLRERNIQRVVVVGLATDYCVKETALDALRLGFHTVVPTAAVRAVNLEPGDGDRALAAISAARGEIER